MNSEIAWTYLINFLSGEFQSHSEAAYLAFKLAEKAGKVDCTPPISNKL